MQQIDAEWACLIFGNVRVMDFEEGKVDIEGIRNDDKAAYKYINLGNGADEITSMLKPGNGGGCIDVSIDQPWGPSMGTIKIPATPLGEK